MEEIRCLKRGNIELKITTTETEEIILYNHCRIYLDEPIDSSEGAIIDAQGRRYPL